VTSIEVSASVARIGIGDAPEAGHRLLAAVVERRLPIVALERTRPSLEDVFLRLTGRRAREGAAT
jgi:hypothetical protein